MDTIGKYQLVRLIGEGGMGRVYEAIDPIIGRRVAIKTISLTTVIDAETRARFFREAQAAGQLSHPNLITIHDIGEADGTPYIVMEYLEGMDLQRKIRQERLPYDTKVQIMIDVCEGLAFAHGHDIIHRDIKPANIFVSTSGRVKILDFGLARGTLSEMTQTGKILGSPNYMAPEQIRAEEVDHRADIFATGVVFYELLTGRKAFEGDSIATTIYKVLETHPQPVHLVDESLPAAISGIIERALAKDRRERFQASSEMLDALFHAHGRTPHFGPGHLPPFTPPPAGPSTMPVPVSVPGLTSASVPGPTSASVPAQTTVPGPAAPNRRSASAIAGWVVAGVTVTSIAGFALWNQRARETRPSAAATQLPPSSSAPPSTPAPEAVPRPAPEPAAPASTARGAVPSPADPNRAAKATTPPVPVIAAKPAQPASSPPVVAPPVPEPETKAAPPPPPPAPVAATPPETKPAPVEPPAAAAPVVSTPAPPPVTPPTVRPEENPVTAVQAVLARYRAALESRDIGALKRIWPTLSGRQEDALRTEFEHARAIVVGLDSVDIRPTNGGATLTCRRNYSVTTADGQTLRTATTMFMTLARRDGAWSIDTIRHEAAR